MKTWCTLYCFLWLAASGHGQDSSSTPFILRAAQPGFTKQPRRTVLAVSGLTASYGGALYTLDKAWYHQYNRTGFHLFNDSREWLQVDKAGHGWSAYQLTRTSLPVWQWAGFKNDQALWAAGTGSMFLLTGIEWMDAHSEKWGWSWADMAANTAGILLFTGQQLGWQEQRIAFKFSVAPKRYPADLRQRATTLFGNSLPERILKDYNSQTYWLSVNLKTFLDLKELPSWLNLAVGYGATGMFGGFGNVAAATGNNPGFYHPEISRVRQGYLSPDIDFTKLKTKRKVLRTLLFALNALKLPAPGFKLERGKLKVGVY